MGGDAYVSGYGERVRIGRGRFSTPQLGGRQQVINLINCVNIATK
jgi:hypothetical protein